MRFVVFTISHTHTHTASAFSKSPKTCWCLSCAFCCRPLSLLCVRLRVSVCESPWVAVAFLVSSSCPAMNEFNAGRQTCVKLDSAWGGGSKAGNIPGRLQAAPDQVEKGVANKANRHGCGQHGPFFFPFSFCVDLAIVPAALTVMVSQGTSME